MPFALHGNLPQTFFVMAIAGYSRRRSALVSASHDSLPHLVLTIGSRLPFRPPLALHALAPDRVLLAPVPDHNLYFPPPDTSLLTSQDNNGDNYNIVEENMSAVAHGNKGQSA
jgi:hypothetical protein